MPSKTCHVYWCIALVDPRYPKSEACSVHQHKSEPFPPPVQKELQRRYEGGDITGERAMSEQPRLAVGDRCWFLDSPSLCMVVDIVEVRVCLPGDPLEFAMYRVQGEDGTRWYETHSQHRSDLFKIPEERSLLLQRISDWGSALINLRDTIEYEERPAGQIPLGMI